MDIQRTILWVIFAMSLLFLWDKWQISQGRPSMLGGTPPAAEKKVDGAPTPGGPADVGAVPTAPQQPGQAAAPAPAAVPSPAPAAQAAPSGERVKIETDMMRAEIDPAGASLAHVELLKQQVAPDWTASGFVGLFTGKKQDRDQHIVLLEWNKN